MLICKFRRRGDTRRKLTSTMDGETKAIKDQKIKEIMDGEIKEMMVGETKAMTAGETKVAIMDGGIKAEMMVGEIKAETKETMVGAIKVEMMDGEIKAAIMVGVTKVEIMDGEIKAETMDGEIQKIVDGAIKEAILVWRMHYLGINRCGEIIYLDQLGCKNKSKDKHSASWFQDSNKINLT